MDKAVRLRLTAPAVQRSREKRMENIFQSRQVERWSFNFVNCFICFTQALNCKKFKTVFEKINK